MKTICFSVPAMVLLMCGSGFASTIVQTKGATLLNVGQQFGVPVVVEPFNTTLGTLTSVTIQLAANFAGTVGVENLSAVPDKAGLSRVRSQSRTAMVPCSPKFFPPLPSLFTIYPPPMARWITQVLPGRPTLSRERLCPPV